jgi:hypothetical protein
VERRVWTGAITVDELEAGNCPVVLEGLLEGAPAVATGRQSPQAVADYLMRFDTGEALPVLVTPPSAGGTFFYNSELTGLNFETRRRPLSRILEWYLANLETPSPEGVYLQALAIERALPHFHAENRLALAPEGAEAHLWIGNRIRVQTHFDLKYNLVCNLAGTRRFTLFPPEEVGNLYPGPLDATPAGVPVSMVTENADQERFPRYAEALARSQVAHLEPGDVLFIPYLWWHKVDALGGLNVMVNYWWRRGRDRVPPFVALYTALLAFRQMTHNERSAWASMVQHFVFGDFPTAHLPDHMRGLCGGIDEAGVTRIKTAIIDELRRGA